MSIRSAKRHPLSLWHPKQFLRHRTAGRTELVVRGWQFRCDRCRKFFTPRHPALAEGAHATERFLVRLAEGGEGARRGPLAREVAGHRRAVPKKRHRQFCCVLIDHTNRRVLDVLETREKAAVVAWLAAHKASGLLANLEEVTCDMWDAYAEGAGEVSGDAVRVTIDRFHVMKNFQDRLAAARREIQKVLPAERAKELKGSRWLWVTNPENLAPGQRKELEALQRKFPELAKLSRHREALRRIFEDKRVRRPETAAAWLRAWCERGRRMGLAALEPFYKTLENWMDKIANYFVARSSNGRTEGFNRGLRAILWRACGMTNFQHFRLRVLHAFG